MTNILTTITVIAAYLVIRSLCNAIKIMQYESHRARRLRMSLTELRDDLNRQYYSQNMRETYERNRF